MSTANQKPRGFLRRCIFTTDHKTIGLQYIFLSLAAVLAGTFLSLLMRIHVVWPQAAIPFLGAIKPEDYLGYLTMHGTLMVFFVLSTAPQSGFGNYFLPLQLGAAEIPEGRDVLLTLRSQDVIHSLFIPAMRFKQDAVPGMEIHAHFKPMQTGDYEIACTQLCGLGHYRMRAAVRVVSEEEFRKWLDEKSKSK